MELRTAFAVFLGGGAGAVIRWLIGVGMGHWSTVGFPWATLIANILSIVILIGAAHILPNFTSVSLRPLIIVGICGGLSTFSTFSYETVQLLRDGEWPIAATNVVLSVAVCMAALWFLLPESD